MSSQIPVASIDWWATFDEEIKRLEQRAAFLGSPTVLYRGLGNAEWELETTLERASPSERVSTSCDYFGYYEEVYVAKHALEVFGKTSFGPLPSPEHFLELAANTGVLINGIPKGQMGEAVYKYLIYLRHHGFPSPLLDWTRSPYLAACFAFDTMPREAALVTVYAMLPRLDVYVAQDATRLIFMGPFVAAHARHFRQQCDYSLCLRRNESLAIEFAPHKDGITWGFGDRDRLNKITIPASERRLFLKKLDSMNINPFTVYDSEDSLVRTLARQRLLFP